MNIRTIGIIGFLGWALLACNGTNIQRIVGPSNPYEQYRNFLQSTEFENSAMVRDWIAAEKEAISKPITINLPYQEITQFEKSRPQAVYFEFDTQEGQLITAEINPVSQPDAKFFLDLYEIENSERKHLKFAKDTNRIEHRVRNSGRMGLRIQPELFRGGIVEVRILQNPSLAFPVEGKNHRSIASFFGDPRDGGRRRHEGVDVFAPRGTPVVSVSPGRVSRVGVNNLGGKTVSVSQDGYSYYYAHLDTQLVRMGQAVKTGDTLGTVGNTGNAITTPPHLHFGIYRRGAVDPYPFFETASIQASHTLSDSTYLGGIARVNVGTANIRQLPNTNAAISGKLSQNEVLLLEGKHNDWFRIRLPDGSQGYVFENLITHDLFPVQKLRETQGLMVSENYNERNFFEASTIAESDLEVIGKFKDAMLLRTELGKLYWTF
jgi:murein DD-endopeptidase MepM/ murein hydrolase activator NlpD